MPSPKTTKPPLRPRIVQASFAAGAKARAELPAPIGIEIAFLGRSNVGKSSLLNALTGRRNLARTSGTPGCTRQISFFQVVTSEGASLHLVDLPGYGYAKRSKAEREAWAELIETYLLERPTLTLVVILFDVRRGLEQEELDLLTMLKEPPRVARPPLEILLVATKLDRVPAAQRKIAAIKVQNAYGRPCVATSLSDPSSIVRLWQQIRRMLGLARDPTVPG